MLNKNKKRCLGLTSNGVCMRHFKILLEQHEYFFLTKYFKKRYKKLNKKITQQLITLEEFWNFKIPTADLAARKFSNNKNEKII